MIILEGVVDDLIDYRACWSYRPQERDVFSLDDDYRLRLETATLQISTDTVHIESREAFASEILENFPAHPRFIFRHTRSHFYRILHARGLEIKSSP